MKVDGIYRMGFVEITMNAGGVKVRDGKAFAPLSVTTKIIRWRFLIWRLADMFCVTLDIQLPEPKMIDLRLDL